MRGRVFIVGLGPGSREHITRRAEEALAESEVVVGYPLYLKQVEELIEGKEVVSGGMGEELRRAAEAVSLALEGRKVAVVSSGDAGVYGMASAVLEYIAGRELEVEVEVVPGVTSALACAALLGSPLGNDFAVVSLSDLLVPWEEIERRLEHAAAADFVVALYNPGSRRRSWQMRRAKEVLLKHRSPETPAGVVRNASRDGESSELTTLGKLPERVDMLTTVIVGNSRSYTYRGWMITPRGYTSKYSLRDTG